jgi:hypothetical protein
MKPDIKTGVTKMADLKLVTSTQSNHCGIGSDAAQVEPATPARLLGTTMAALHAFLAHDFGTAWQLYALCGLYAEEVGMGNDAITLFSAAAKLNQELHEAGSAVAPADVAPAADVQGVLL